MCKISLRPISRCFRIGSHSAREIGPGPGALFLSPFYQGGIAGGCGVGLVRPHPPTVPTGWSSTPADRPYSRPDGVLVCPSVCLWFGLVSSWFWLVCSWVCLWFWLIVHGFGLFVHGFV